MQKSSLAEEDLVKISKFWLVSLFENCHKGNKNSGTKGSANGDCN